MTGQLSALAQGKAAGAPAGYTIKLLKTGQTTQYDSELDDGYYQIGVATKSYTVNTSGAQSGTTNVDLAHYAGAAGAIAFNNTAKTITDTGNGLAIFKTNDIILTDSANNPGPFTVTTGNVAGTITCTGATFTDETPAGAVTLYKREAISNNTVLDNNTGLEWMRYCPVKFGFASNGRMPWTGKLYDAFQYCAQANAVSLGGHNDWRLANIIELFSLSDKSYGLNSTAFPSNYNSYLWSSTTTPDETARARSFYRGTVTNHNKEPDDAGYDYTFLVRGGLS